MPSLSARLRPSPMMWSICANQSLSRLGSGDPPPSMRMMLSNLRRDDRNMTVDQSRRSAVERHRSAWGYLAAGGILIGGVVTYLIVLFVMIDTQNVNFFPSLLLVGAITVPMSVLVLANQAGPASRVPSWAIVFTAIVGGVIGVVAAGLLEYDTLRDLGSVPMVLIGIIEEAAKLIVPVILYLLWRPQDPRSGVIIGIASGMGFAILETMGYGFQGPDGRRRRRR